MTRSTVALTIAIVLIAFGSSGAQIVLPGTQPGDLVNWPLLQPSNCAACHGSRGQGSTDGYYPSLVNNITVDYYGTPTRLRDIANISTPEPRLIVVNPFDPSSIGLIEKGKYNPTLNLCINIAQNLGKTLNDLFWDENEN